MKPAVNGCKNKLNIVGNQLIGLRGSQQQQEQQP
jgi:hypothetical protein